MRLVSVGGVGDNQRQSRSSAEGETVLGNAAQRKTTVKQLRCTAVRQLRQAIDRFVKAYKKASTPFEWTKAVVFPSAHQH
jgi:hypothetical protein